MACLLGLLRIDRLASAISAVTRVIVILAMDLHIRKVTTVYPTTHISYFVTSQQSVYHTFLQICVLKNQRELFASCL